MKFSKDQIAEVSRKIMLSQYKSGYSIPLYAVETFKDLNTAWFYSKLMSLKPANLTSSVYIITIEDFNKLFKAEVELPNLLKASIISYFEDNKFIEIASKTGVVVYSGKLDEFIIESIGG